MPLSKYQEANWPLDRALPTEEEIKLAEQRMRELSEKGRAAGYQGDWGFDLHLTMATYNRACWWHLFFPDEKISLEEGMATMRPVPFPHHPH